MKSVVVFCGSSFGNNDIFRTEAFLLGQTLAEKNIRLVYGGAKVGLMGAVADGALKAGGEVIGVLPKFLKDKELAHERLTELIIVESMHERKLKMNELCDGVVALPGGYGTLEELFEMITWAQLGLHKKPVAVLNTNGFYNNLALHVENMIGAGFLKKENKDILIMSETVEGMLQQMISYQAPATEKWITTNKV